MQHCIKLKEQNKKEIKRMLITYICVELSNEAGEVVVLEVTGQDGGGELVGIPDDEAVASSAPRNNGVGGRILHHVEGLGEERGRTHIVKPFHGLWRNA